ncbi:anaerobic sulfite reductase subunit AsrA [Anaerobium acetethylicum]|uniref:Anaerobic sulfite reductase subunit A n=1 Tax=Anaerobium acetethylicum TaxID=1619234 RepID=A0A1D3TPE6_9FIRM|nr:anaerobic sulfite reductase subunit AsrA [Anaerobium acetethylicum]SCP95297.1 anaerobic sulfite reductase subunit A [Anaerobium acetethylicum]
MGFLFAENGINAVFEKWAEEYHVYAPKRMEGKGAFSDTDSVRYEEINKVEEIEFDLKSHFSFKDILLPMSETLFFFTEEQVKEADGPKKGAVILLRSCDLHAVRRLDEIYLKNGFEDYYYKRLRENVRFVLLGCKQAFENCFCVDMETNRADFYDASIEKDGDGYAVDNHYSDWEPLFLANSMEKKEVSPSYVTETEVRVEVPEGLSLDVSKSRMWDEYDKRCIDCGRCNYVCPTCTCFTMQDIFYTDNGKVGERRRVTASCMVNGYTDVAGGGSYRQKNGQRMRFKTLHKVYDFKKRFGYHMCVGCGRCDDACPEYISFSNIINKLKDAVAEVNDHDEK